MSAKLGLKLQQELSSRGMQRTLTFKSKLTHTHNVNQFDTVINYSTFVFKLVGAADFNAFVSVRGFCNE